jgi:hypothetical protein
MPQQSPLVMVRRLHLVVRTKATLIAALHAQEAAALELRPAALAGMHGLLRVHPAFDEVV